jgi:hypothetical protein
LDLDVLEAVGLELFDEGSFFFAQLLVVFFGVHAELQADRSQRKARRLTI